MISAFDVLSLRSKSKELFDAYIFTFPQLVKVIQRRAINEINKKDIRKVFQEIFDVTPLYFEFICITKSRWLVGKIKQSDHPYDVFLIPEQLARQKRGRRYIGLFGTCFVQTKRIQLNEEPFSSEEFQKALQKEIDKYKKKNPGHNGILHFYCPTGFTEPLRDKDFYEMFERLSIFGLKKTDGITISYRVFDIQSSVETIRTWLIYPKITPLGSLNDSLNLAKQIYVNGTNQPIHDIVRP